MTTNDKIFDRTFIIALLVLAVTLVLTLLISTRGLPRVMATNLEKMPMEINGMHGVDDSFPESVYKALNADVNVYRHYRSDDGRQVDLYIGYYGTAKGGRTGHNPIGCLPSQGWGLQEESQVTLRSSFYPDGVPVNYLISTKGDVCISTIYWYQTAGNRVVSDGVRQNIQRFLGMVFRNRNDGAFVRVTLLSDKNDVATARANASSFSEHVLNLLPGYWPVEK